MTRRSIDDFDHIIDYFEANAEDFPKKVAVYTSDHREITYQALNEKANRLACLYQKQGIKRGSGIAIVSSRTEEAIVSMLASAKLGAYFVLIDPQNLNKSGVVKNKLQECNVELIVTFKEFLDCLPSTEIETMSFESMDLNNEAFSAENLSPELRAITDDDPHLLYIAYTSGTTDGKGKGVMIANVRGNGSPAKFFVGMAHESILNFDLEKDVMAWRTPIEFDPTLNAVFTGLLGGGSVQILNNRQRDDLGKIPTHVNIIIAMPDNIDVLLRDGQQKRNAKKRENFRIITTGSKLEEHHARKMHECGIKVIDGLGPTEATVGLTASPLIIKDKRIIIDVGQVIPGSKYKIVDSKTGEEVEEGEVGEMIYRSEAFLGYVNREEETKQRYAHYKDGKDWGKHWWRTGDLLQQRQENIEGALIKYCLFRGRLHSDKSQVKLFGGVRIEASSVENEFMKAFGHVIGGARTVVASPSLEQGGSKRLVTFASLNNELSPEDKLGMICYLRSNVTRFSMHQFIFIKEDLSKFLTNRNKRNNQTLLNKYSSEIFPQRDRAGEITTKAMLFKFWKKIFGYDLSNLESEELANITWQGSSLDLCDLADRICGFEGFDSYLFWPMLCQKVASNPQLSCIIEFIDGYRELVNAVEYIGVERNSKPVWLFASEDFDINALPQHQPICWVKNPDLDPEKLGQLLGRKQSLGPYFIVYEEKYRTQVEKIHKVSIDKEDEIHACELSDSDDSLKKDALDAYSEYFRTHCLEKAKERLDRDNNTVQIRYQDNQIIHLESHFASQGYTQYELELIREEPIELRIEGITHPYQIRQIYADLDRENFPNVKIIWMVSENPFLHEAIKKEIDLGDKLELEQHNFDQVLTLSEWYSNYIDRYCPNLSIAQKADLFDDCIEYARELAVWVNEHGPSIPKRDSLRSIWSTTEIEGKAEDLLDLFDMQDKKNHFFFSAAPLKFDNGEMHFIKDDDKSLDTVKNPFTEAAYDQSLSYSGLKNISRIYHAQAPGCPIFLFHPITGQKSFRILSENMRALHPIVSIGHPIWADEEVEGLDSVLALAEYYKQLIEVAYPKGPIVVAGWSFGGYVAYEIARLFDEDDRVVELIGLIDTPSPGFMAKYLNSPGEHKAFLLNRMEWVILHCNIPNAEQVIYAINSIDFNVKDQITLATELWEKLQKHVEKQEDVFKSKVAFQDTLKIIKMCSNNNTATLKYVEEHKRDNILLGKARFFKAQNSSEYHQLIQDNECWELEDSAVTTISGDHFSLTQNPENARKLGAEILKCLSPLRENRLEHDVYKRLAIINQAHARDFQSSMPPEQERLNLNLPQDKNIENSMLILGGSGSGKTTLMKSWFLNTLKNSRKKAQQRLMFYIDLRDFPYESFKHYLEILDFSQIAIEEICEKPWICFIDDIDGYGASRFLSLARGMREMQSNITFVVSCKKDYFESQKQLREYCEFSIRAEPLHIAPLANEEVRRSVGKSTVIAPPRNVMQLKIFNRVLPKLKKGFFDPVSRASLYRHDIELRAKQHALNFDSLMHFGEELAIIYFTQDLGVLECQLLTQEKLIRDRYDTDLLINALGLYQIGSGWVPPHNSYYEFFLARRIFTEIIQGVPYESSILNHFILADQHEVLAFLADFYDEYVFQHPEQELRGEESIDLLYQYFEASRNNKTYKNLSANALSILCRIEDLSLRLELDFKNIFSARTNISKTNLSKCTSLNDWECDTTIKKGAIFPEGTIENEVIEHKIEGLSGLAKYAGSIYAITREKNGLGFSLKEMKNLDVVQSGIKVIPVEEMNPNFVDEKTLLLRCKPNRVYTDPNSKMIAVLSEYGTLSERINKDTVRWNGKRLLQFQLEGELYWSYGLDLAYALNINLTFDSASEEKVAFATAINRGQLSIFRFDIKAKEVTISTSLDRSVKNTYVINSVSNKLLFYQDKQVYLVDQTTLEIELMEMDLFGLDSDDDKVVYVCSNENTSQVLICIKKSVGYKLYIYDLDSQEVIKILEINAISIDKICFFKNDLFYWADSHLVRLKLDIDESCVFLTKQTYFSGDRQMLFSGDSIYVYSGEHGNSVSIIEHQHTAMVMSQQKNEKGPVDDVIAYPDGPWIFELTHSHINIYDNRSGRIVKKIPYAGKNGHKLFLSPDNKYLIVTGIYDIHAISLDDGCTYAISEYLSKQTISCVSSLVFDAKFPNTLLFLTRGDLVSWNWIKGTSHYVNITSQLSSLISVKQVKNDSPLYIFVFSGTKVYEAIGADFIASRREEKTRKAGEKLYIFNGKSNKALEFSEYTQESPRANIASSNDGSYTLFSFKGDENFVSYFFDFKNNKTYEMEVSERFGKISFSPNDQYIIVNHGRDHVVLWGINENNPEKPLYPVCTVHKPCDFKVSALIWATSNTFFLIDNVGYQYYFIIRDDVTVEFVWTDALNVVGSFSGKSYGLLEYSVEEVDLAPVEIEMAFEEVVDLAQRKKVGQKESIPIAWEQILSELADIMKIHDYLFNNDYLKRLYAREIIDHFRQEVIPKILQLLGSAMDLAPDCVNLIESLRKIFNLLQNNDDPALVDDSLELYLNFLNKIDQNLLAPGYFTMSFYQKMPVLIKHIRECYKYLDLNEGKLPYDEKVSNIFSNFLEKVKRIDLSDELHVNQILNAIVFCFWWNNRKDEEGGDLWCFDSEGRSYQKLQPYNSQGMFKNLMYYINEGYPALIDWLNRVNLDLQDSEEPNFAKMHQIMNAIIKKLTILNDEFLEEKTLPYFLNNRGEEFRLCFENIHVLLEHEQPNAASLFSKTNSDFAEAASCIQNIYQGKEETPLLPTLRNLLYLIKNHERLVELLNELLRIALGNSQSADAYLSRNPEEHQKTGIFPH